MCRDPLHTAKNRKKTKKIRWVRVRTRRCRVRAARSPSPRPAGAAGGRRTRILTPPAARVAASSHRRALGAAARGSMAARSRWPHGAPPRVLRLHARVRALTATASRRSVLARRAPQLHRRAQRLRCRLLPTAARSPLSAAATACRRGPAPPPRERMREMRGGGPARSFKRKRERDDPPQDV